MVEQMESIYLEFAIERKSATIKVWQKPKGRQKNGKA